MEDLGWCRHTVSKGMHKLRSGVTYVDAFRLRRRRIRTGA
jgi:hypothetical protein